MDRGIVAKLADAGFLGAALPEEYGGMGLDTVSYCLLCEELGRSDSSVRGIVSVSNGLYGKTVAKWGTEEQKAAWLPGLCSGESLGAYALTEPGSGSDPGSLTTRAERDGNAWVLSGSKIFITLGTWAARALVFARTSDEGARGITCFAVPTDAAGFEARPIKGKLGLRSQDTGELFLDGVRVEDSNRLGDVGAGFKVAMSALDNGRISLAAGCVGIAQGCLDACVGYAKERRQFGKPIAGFQLVQAARRHRGRDGGGAAADVARGRPFRRGHEAHGRVLGREVLRQRGVRPRRERRRADPRWLRLRGRVSRREVPAGRARYHLVRGHEPDPETDHRTSIDRGERIHMSEAVIVETVRTPIGRAGKGSLADVRPDDLLAFAIRTLLEKVPALDAAEVVDVMVGCGFPQEKQA